MPTRLWLDGCFDGFHFAHANAVRQALSLVSDPAVLVGVHSDKEITKNKGPPLFSERERYDLIRSCRWVSEVIEDVPYVTDLDVIDKYKADYVAHGDDPVVDALGNDCYAFAKAAGRYKEFKRTEGISTTSLITRLNNPSSAIADEVPLRLLLDAFASAVVPKLPVVDFGTDASEFTSSINGQARATNKTVIYISASWDCFGAGHVELLRHARAVAPSQDVLLLVGVWSDDFVKSQSSEAPLLHMLERALALAQCRYVDGIVLSAPPLFPTTLIRDLSISMIINPLPGYDTNTVRVEHVEESKLHTIATLRARVSARRTEYDERQRRKGA